MRKLQTKWSRICGQLRDVVTRRCTAASASACWRPMEPLEPRLLLTSVDVTLVSVLTPSPDDSSVLPSPITHVSVGDTYFLEVWMQDVSAGVGITGGQVDLLYSTTPADAIAVVNDDFDLFASDGIDDALGVVDNLGGGSLASGLGVTPDFARLAYVEMQATAEGNTTFSLAPGSLRFALLGLGNIEFSEVDLTDTIAVFHKPPIGESGQVTNLTHVPQTVVLSRSYANPVVFAQSPSYNGIEEAVVRVTNVQSNQFAMFMQEPSNLNGTHIEESVSYVVLEAGQWQLPNGEMLEVGTLDTSSTVGRRQPSPQWETMAFANAFGGIPVVLSQVQTTNDASFVKTRQNSLTTDSFDVALEGEEIDTTQHGLETIGYMALDAGTGQWGSITYEGFVTPTVFTDAGSTLTFSHSFSQAPNFLSSLSTHNGQDPSELRYSNLTGTGAQIFVEEDTTFDTEKIHIAEGFSYLALDGNGLLVGDPLVTAPTSVGEVGRITNLTHVAQVISLQRTYLNPVVFAQSPSLNGAQPVVVRISDVQTNQFTVFLQEPSNLDGTHIAETVSYTVFEAGRWQLPNGALLEVGSVSSSATVGSQLNSPQWQTLSFVNAFPAVPVILSQVQTNNDASFVKTRQNNALAGGFHIAMEGEESATQPHGTETIGYLALEAGSGLWSGIAYEGFNTSAVFTDVSSILSFNQIFSGAPSLLASLSTYNGGDSSELRYDNLTTTNVQVRVEEDTTFDAEVGHTSEALSYLAFAGTGFLQGQVLGPALADPSVGTLELVTSAASEQAKMNLIDGLAFDAFGNLFGALEIGGSGGSVVYIDKVTGLVTNLVSGISRADQIALHPGSGDFFVTSEVAPTSTTNRLFRVTPAYNASNIPTTASKVSVTTSLGINNPEGLVVIDSTGTFGNSGDLYVTEDANPGSVFRVEPSNGDTTSLVSGLARPEGLAFGNFGGAVTAALYTAETTDDNVLKIDSVGTVTVLGAPASVGLNNPDNVEFGPDGLLYVSEDRQAPDSRIIRIAFDGTHTVFATGFGQASGLIFDPTNGDLYIAEQDFDRVWRVRFTPAPAASMAGDVQASVEAAADPATGPSSSSQFLRGVVQAAQITASANKSMLFAASQRWATKQSVQLDRTQTPWMDQLLLSTRGDAADGPIESLVQIV